MEILINLSFFLVLIAFLCCKVLVSLLECSHIYVALVFKDMLFGASFYFPVEVEVVAFGSYHGGSGAEP